MSVARFTVILRRFAVGLRSVAVRPGVLAVALALLAAPVAAQNKVRTETIPVTPPAAGTRTTTAPPATKGPAASRAVRADRPAPEVIDDLTRLPKPVARMRARILEAAKSGSLERVVTVMQSNELMPIFSFGADKDPVAHWTATFPDSKGLELLGILVDILEAPFVHADRGTAQEMFVWPYFAKYPIRQLSPEQTVELFRIMTGADYRDMIEFGAYAFYRVGIAPDGVWHFFVAGD